jgi:hypothetical protein
VVVIHQPSLWRKGAIKDETNDTLFLSRAADEDHFLKANREMNLPLKISVPTRDSSAKAFRPRPKTTCRLSFAPRQQAKVSGRFVVSPCPAS